MENKKLNENELNQAAGGRPVVLTVNAEDHNVMLTKVRGDVKNAGTPGEDIAFIPIAIPAAELKPEPEKAREGR